MTTVTRGLFIGRFQPFHNGHLYAIEKILNENDEIIIGIGSAQDSYSLKNPLTAGERIEMIRELARDIGILDEVIIVPIPDIYENMVWPARVIELVPRFDKVYSGNELVLMLFENFGIKTIRIKHINRYMYQGSVIRDKIIKGEDWKDLVPETVYQYLKEVKFEERIKRLVENKSEVRR